MTINEFIEKYSSNNFNSFIKENATIDYWNDLIKTYKLEKLKFVFPDTMQLSLNPLLKEGSDMFWGKEFDGFCERQIEILKIENQYKPQQTKYNLFTFFENLKNDWEYIQLNERLNTDAGIQTNLGIKSKDGTTANVYSAGMWYILTKDEYKNEGFIDAYCKGFEDGKQFITNKTNNALNGFYKSCTNEYIEELHYAYFFNAENYILGYKNGACNYPIAFYIDSIEKIGFSAGVVTAIDLMAKENPILFAGFYDIDTEAPQQPKAVIPDEVKKEFKEFFNPDVSINVIETIQSDFKEYKGKKMAYLIYLLHRDFKVINYSLNSRTESRKHFVSVLKETNFRMTGIDNYFELNDVRMKYSKFDEDPDYIDIKEKLLKTIK